MKLIQIKEKRFFLIVSLLLCFFLFTASVAYADEPETQQTPTTQDAYENYLKGKDADDASEVGNLAWYENNSAILDNHSVVSDVLRNIGFDITIGICALSDVCETLYDNTFGLIDITRYGKVDALLQTLKPVLIALTCLCVAGLGLTLMVKREKVPLVRNILLGILAVSCSGYIFMTANNMAVSFKDGILGGRTVSQSYTLVNDNIIDLINIDKKGGINALNYAAGSGIIYGAGIKEAKDLALIDMTETLDWYTAKNGKNLYGWSSDFNNKIKFHIKKTDSGVVAEKNDDGITKANIGNKFYYRYSFDFWSCTLQLLALVLLFCALSYKNVRIAYELVVSRILAYMYAADVSNGERLKSILCFIRDTYITLLVSVLCVRLYTIFIGAITSLGINGLTKGLASIFIAYAVIDGPNLVERLLGMDAGLKSSFARTMAIAHVVGGAAKTALHVGAGAANGAAKAAAAVATGKSAAERRADNGNSSLGERFGKTMNEKMKAKRAARSDKDSEAAATAGQSPDFSVGEAGHSAAFSGTSVEQGAQSAFDSAMHESVAERDAARQAATSMAGVRAAQRGNSVVPSQIGTPTAKVEKSRSQNDMRRTAPPKPTGQRVSNPEFTAAVKRLAPAADASENERKDFNRQMNAIVRGKKHKAIELAPDAPVYQQRNYEKAQELERAYHSFKPTNKKEANPQNGK